MNNHLILGPNGMCACGVYNLSTARCSELIATVEQLQAWCAAEINPWLIIPKGGVGPSLPSPQALHLLAAVLMANVKNADELKEETACDSAGELALKLGEALDANKRANAYIGEVSNQLAAANQRAEKAQERYAMVSKAHESGIAERDQLHADKEKAEACCAEMRSVLDYIQFDFDPEKHAGPPCGPDALAKIKHALSSTCGQGWVSPERNAALLAYINEQAALADKSAKEWSAQSERQSAYRAGMWYAYNDIKNRLTSPNPLTKENKQTKDSHATIP